MNKLVLASGLMAVANAGAPGGAEPTKYTVADLPDRAQLTADTQGCWDDSYAGKPWAPTKTANGDKWNICHGTAADSNPYTSISVDEHAAVEHLLGNGQGHGGANKRLDIFPMQVGDVLRADESASCNCVVDCNCDKIHAQAPTVTLGAIAGDEDTDIAFPLTVTSNDYPGLTTIDVFVSGVPADATLSAGTRGEDGVYHLTLAQVEAGLTIRQAANSDADMAITVSARSTLNCDDSDFVASGAVLETITTTSTDAAGNPVTSTTTAWNDANGGHTGVPNEAAVTVNAIADEPTLASLDDVTMSEDSSITVTLSGALADTDGSETLSFSGSCNGAVCTIVNNGNGVFTVSPVANSDADFTVNFFAAATESSNNDVATVGKALRVIVRAVADAPTDLTGVPEGFLTLETGASWDIDFSATNNDADSETVSYSCEPAELFDGGCSGAITSGTAGAHTLTFTATSTESGEESATDCDGGRCSSSSTRTVDVTFYAPPPAFAPGAAPGGEASTADASSFFPSFSFDFGAATFSADLAASNPNGLDAYAPLSFSGAATCPSDSCSWSVSCAGCELSAGGEANAALSDVQVTLNRGFDADQLVTLKLTDNNSFRQASTTFKVASSQRCLLGATMNPANGVAKALFSDAGQLVVNPDTGKLHKITICHGNNGGKGYTINEVDWSSLGNGHFVNPFCESAIEANDYLGCLKSFDTEASYSYPADHSGGHPENPDMVVGSFRKATRDFDGIKAGDQFRATCGCDMAPATPLAKTFVAATLSAGSSTLVSVRCDLPTGCWLSTSGNININIVKAITDAGNNGGFARRLLAAGDTFVPQGDSDVVVTVDQTRGYTRTTEFTIEVVDYPTGSQTTLAAGQAAAVSAETGMATGAVLGIVVASLAGVLVVLFAAKKVMAKKQIEAVVAAKNEAVNATGPAAHAIDIKKEEAKTLLQYASASQAPAAAVAAKDVKMKISHSRSKSIILAQGGEMVGSGIKKAADAAEQEGLQIVKFPGFKAQVPK